MDLLREGEERGRGEWSEVGRERRERERREETAGLGNAP
jgi:hypothetical protein